MRKTGKRRGGGFFSSGTIDKASEEEAEYIASMLMTGGADPDNLLGLLRRIYKKNHGTAIVNHIFTSICNIGIRGNEKLHDNDAQELTKHIMYCRFETAKENMTSSVITKYKGSDDVRRFLDKLKDKVSEQYFYLQDLIGGRNGTGTVSECSIYSTETT